MTEPSIQEQLEQAVRDLWTTLDESGEEYIVFMDRRRLRTRVERTTDGRYQVNWEQEEDGPWLLHDHTFENPREAAFHGYQGPH